MSRLLCFGLTSGSRRRSIHLYLVRSHPMKIYQRSRILQVPWVKYTVLMQVIQLCHENRSEVQSGSKKGRHYRTTVHFETNCAIGYWVSDLAL